MCIHQPAYLCIHVCVCVCVFVHNTIYCIIYVRTYVYTHILYSRGVNNCMVIELVAPGRSMTVHTSTCHDSAYINLPWQCIHQPAYLHDSAYIIHHTSTCLFTHPHTSLCIIHTHMYVYTHIWYYRGGNDCTVIEVAKPGRGVNGRSASQRKAIIVTARFAPPRVTRICKYFLHTTMAVCLYIHRRHCKVRPASCDTHAQIFYL
jgi:hypothetical protein